MQTGAQTGQAKAITYEMLELAVNALNRKGRFTAADFKERFAAEYRAAPCRYSMTGGVLVAVGVAVLVAGRREGTCEYESA